MLSESTLRIVIDSTGAARKAEELERRLKSLEDAGVRVGGSMDKQNTAINQQRQAMEKLLGRIDPVVGRLSQLDKMEQELRKHHKAGLLPKDDFDEYIAKIDSTRQAVGGFGDQLDKTGKSAGQTRMALQQLPMQFTDIWVSLAAGQNPMTVFIQQGTQIRDSFGSSGAALKAMAGYLKGMINPLTVSAAATAAVGLSMYQAASRTDDFEAALAVTNDAIGRTAPQLQALAESIGDQTGNAGAAREAILQMVNAGETSFERLSQVSESVARRNRATGESVEDLIGQYQDIAKDPVQALVDLDDKYHFLTASTLTQIDTLVRQGQEQKAVEMAMREWSQASDEASKRVIENMNAVDRTLQKIKAGFGEIWEGFGEFVNDEVSKSLGDLGIGNVDDRIKSIQAELKGGFLEWGDGISGLLGRRDGLESELVVLQSIKAMQQLGLDTSKAQTAEQRAQIENWRQANGLMDQYRSSLDRMTGDLSTLKTALSETTDPGRRADIQSAIDELNSRIQAASRTTDSTSKGDAGLRRLQALRQQQVVLMAQVDSTEKLSQAESALLKFNREMADLRSQGRLSTDQQSLLAHEDEIRSQLKANAQLAEQIDQRKDLLKLEERSAQLQDSMASSFGQLNRQYQDRLDAFGLGDKASQRLEEQRAIFREFQKYQNELNEATPKSLLDSDQHRQATQDIRDALEQRLALQRQYYEQLDRMERDWQYGASTALHNYVDDTRNVAGEMSSLFTSAFGSAEDAIVQFVKTGKLEVSDLAASIADDFIRLSVRQSITGPLASALGSAIGFGAGSGTVAPNTYVGAFASGGYISGPGTGTSDSIPARLSNGEFVVNAEATRAHRPFLEAINGPGFASGGYVSPTPNTTPPMSRAAVAALKVPQPASSAKAGGFNVTLNTTVNMPASQGGNEKQQMQQYEKLLRTTQTQQVQQIRKTIYDELRPRGILNRAFQNKGNPGGY